MYKFLTLLILVISHLVASAQSQLFPPGPNIDSLKKLLPGSGYDLQIDILCKLAEHYAPFNFDTGILYSSQAVRLASIYSDPYHIALARFYTGNAYYYKLDFKNALLSYLSAQSLFEQGPYLNELGELNLMLGNINFFIRRSEKTMAYYHKAIGYFQSAGNEKSLVKAYDAINVMMQNLGYGTFDSAMVYTYKMLNYARKHHDRYFEAFALMGMGNFHVGGTTSLAINQKALAYCDSALILATGLKDYGLISLIYLAKGFYYGKNTPFSDITGNPVLSRLYFEKAYQAALKANCAYLQAAFLIYLTEIDLDEKKYDKAKIHLDLSEAALNDFFRFQWKNTPAYGMVLNSVGKLTDYYIAMQFKTSMYYFRYKLADAKGVPGKAIEYLQLYYQARDSMNASQQGRQFEIMMAEDEAGKQAQKLRTMAQDNEMNRLKLSRSRFIFLGAGAGILLLTSVLLLFFQRRKLRAEKRSVAMEQRLLRAQMNPHFIFNSLASIQNYIINEKPEEASMYLSRFSQLVRNVLDNSVEEYVSLENEISAIGNYMELQKARYADKLNFTIEVDPKIDPETMCIPPMLAQPFIENAIEHGIKHRETPGHIYISFSREDHLIHFEVEDDGVGREKAAEIEHRQQSHHRSMSTTITRDRLMTINRKMKKKIRLEIIDLKDENDNTCGTKVTFRIPFVEN